MCSVITAAGPRCVRWALTGGATDLSSGYAPEEAVTGCVGRPIYEAGRTCGHVAFVWKEILAKCTLRAIRMSATMIVG